MTPPTAQRPTLYDALPAQLGGTDSRPVAASLSTLMPLPAGASGPSEPLFNAGLRHKQLQLGTTTSTGGGGVGTSTAVGTNDASDVGATRPARRKRRARTPRFTLPPEEAKHALYAPLRALWRTYAMRALGVDGPMTVAADVLGDRVLRLDLHGAEVAVVRARDPSLVGLCGTVVAETANTIVVVTQKDRAVTVLKAAAVVAFDIGGAEVELALPQLCVRGSERSAKKFKKRHVPWP